MGHHRAALGHVPRHVDVLMPLFQQKLLVLKVPTAYFLPPIDRISVYCLHVVRVSREQTFQPQPGRSLVRISNISAAALCGSLLVFAGCIGQSQTPPVDQLGELERGTLIIAGPDAPKRAQQALIEAKAGDVIEFGEGRFEFKSTLSLDVSGVTIRGQGPDKTILSFQDQGQGTGGEGLLITSKQNVILENLAVEDARGDAIKANGTQKITFRKIRTEWTGGPKETNGGYGIYPVLCTGVVIEDCKVSGARMPASMSASRKISSSATTPFSKTSPASRSKTATAPTSMRTRRPTIPEESLSSPCPTCPPRKARTAASITTR